MIPSNTDLPSIIPLPKDVDLILEAAKRHLESGVDVLIIDRRQQSMVIYSGDLQDTDVTADSLPFLLSNHAVSVLESKPTLEECKDGLLSMEGIVCIFHHPSDQLGEVSLPVHASKIINKGALLGLVESEDKRMLASITLGHENG